MLYITPIQDENMHAAVAEKCGIKATDGSLSYHASDIDEATKEINYIIGICEFTIHDNRGVITALRQADGVNDTEAMMIMARTVMSFIHRTTISDLTFAEGSADESLIKSLGFKKNENGVYGIDLDLFYVSPCRYNGENK